MKISNFMIFLGIAAGIFCFPHMTAAQGVIPVEDEDVREEITSVYKAYGEALGAGRHEVVRDILIIPFYVNKEKFWKWYGMIPKRGLRETYLVGEFEPKGSNRFLFLSKSGSRYSNFHPDEVQMKKTDDGYKIPLMESDLASIVPLSLDPKGYDHSSSPEERLINDIGELKAMDKEELKKARHNKIEDFHARIACLKYARKHGIDYKARKASYGPEGVIIKETKVKEVKDKIEFFESMSPEEFRDNELSRKMKYLKTHDPDIELKDIKPKEPEFNLKGIKSKAKLSFFLRIILTSAVAAAVIAVAVFLIVRAMRRRRPDA